MPKLQAWGERNLTACGRSSERGRVWPCRRQRGQVPRRGGGGGTDGTGLRGVPRFPWQARGCARVGEPSPTPRAAVRGWQSRLVWGPDLRGERRRVAEALLPRRRGCDTLNPSRPNSLFIKVLWSAIRSAHCLILLTNMFCSPIKRGLHLSCQSYSAGVF